MHLIINYSISSKISPDHIRSLWKILSKPRKDAFYLAELPDDIYQAADDVFQGEKVTAAFLHQGISFPIETTLSDLGEQGCLLSLTFTDSTQNDQLLREKEDNNFFPWVLEILKKGGTLLQADIAFLSLEQTPNQIVQIELKAQGFKISKFPLLFWIGKMEHPNNFLQNGGFTKQIQDDGSYYLLPPTLLNTIQSKNKKTPSIKNRIDPETPNILEGIPSPYDRREVIRWVINDYETANENAVNLLRAGLKDTDWEVRMSSIIACARLGAQSLLHEVRKVPLPTTGKSGLNAEERNIMLGIQKSAVHLLNGGSIPPDINKIPETTQEKQAYLLQCVAGVPAKHFHNALLLVIALADPMYPGGEPDLPEAVEEKNGRFFLKKSNIELCWVPNLTHMVGSSAIPYHPIQVTQAEKGFFISKGRIKKETEPTAAWKCTFAEAQQFCKNLSQKEGIEISMPSNLLWEMAARGHNGRNYPWGLSYTNDMLQRESPWGLVHTVGQGGEWSKTVTKKPLNVIMGASNQARCCELNFSTPEQLFPFRIVLEPSSK